MFSPPLLNNEPRLKRLTSPWLESLIKHNNWTFPNSLAFPLSVELLSNKLSLSKPALWSSVCWQSSGTGCFQRCFQRAWLFSLLVFSSLFLLLSLSSFALLLRFLLCFSSPSDPSLSHRIFDRLEALNYTSIILVRRRRNTLGQSLDPFFCHLPSSFSPLFSLLPVFEFRLRISVGRLVVMQLVFLLSVILIFSPSFAFDAHISLRLYAKNNKT